MITMQYGRGSDATGGGGATQLEDSGWVDCSSLLSSEFQLYSGTSFCGYRRIGNIVCFHAGLKPTGTISGGTTAHTILTLPDAAFPGKTVYAVCQGSNAYRWYCGISTAGVVSFSRYGYGATYANATTSTILNIHVVYFVG